MSKSEMKKLETLKPDGRTSKDLICDTCAKAKGWKPTDSCVTVIKGLCGHCEREDETLLTPTCDFKQPGKREAVWD